VFTVYTYPVLAEFKVTQKPVSLLNSKGSITTQKTKQ